MAIKIFVHSSEHKAASWNKTISYMANNKYVAFQNLSYIFEEKWSSSYENLYSLFVKYCNEVNKQIHLYDRSLDDIFDLNFPQKVKTLGLIEAPYKVPKVAFVFPNIIFNSSHQNPFLQ